jgi:hypothetical protein
MNNTTDQFNVILFQLIEELAEITDSPKFKLARNVYKTVIEKEPSKPIEQFIIKVLPIKEKVYSRDEKFFTNYTEKDSTDEQSVITQLITMKPVWTKLTSENKDVIFQYLVQLCRASEHYLQLYLQ